MRQLPHISLRQKFLLSITCYFISISVVGFLSYDDLTTIQRRLSSVEEMQQISNDLLEARRFEKNYLLYGNPDDFAESRNFIHAAQASIHQLDDSVLARSQNSLLEAIRVSIGQYASFLDEVMAAPGPKKEYALEALRLHGKTMVESAERLLAQEMTSIRATIRDLVLQLIISIVAALGIGLFASVLMFGKFISALRIINTATRRIAQGVFEPLPEVDTQEEAQGIVRALNAMVKELDVRQDQLVQAKKLSSLGTLTAGIAHQLNNPLNNISTSSQIALEDLTTCDPDFLKRMLTNIEKESMRAKEIVQGLLEFSREKSFTLSTVRLSEVIDKTLRLVMSQVPATVNISTDIPEGLTLEMDVQRMQEALINLMLNAVQAISPNAGAITLRAGKSGDTVELVVQDTGKGIPQDVVDKVFDPFFTTKGDSGGTGLGLSIVYGVVKRHRGTITVASEPGKGTTFTIRLPLEHGSAA